MNLRNIFSASRVVAPTSHHGGKDDPILNFATLNTYHVSVVA